MIVDDFPDIRQSWSNDCGAACLSAVMKFWGFSHAALLQLGDQHDAASAYDIVQYARAASLDAIGVALMARSIDQEDLPAVLHWDGNHFVVLYETAEDRALILDPARGKASYSWDVLEQRHTGAVILFGAAARRALAEDT